MTNEEEITPPPSEFYKGYKKKCWKCGREFFLPAYWQLSRFHFCCVACRDSYKTEYLAKRQKKITARIETDEQKALFE